MRQPLNWQIGLMGPQRASRYDSQIWNATRRAIENLVFYVSEHLSVHKKPTPISSTLQKVYLENSIFLLSLVSLGLSIILQMDPTFLEISMYRVKDTCMFKDNKSVCTYLKSEYRSRPLEVHTGVSEIEQVMNIAWSRLGYQDPNPEMERTINTVFVQWLEYTSIWPLDIACATFTIGFDVFRRILKRYGKSHDESLMFGMIFLMLGASVIRSVEIKLHFSVIQNINEIAQSLNYRLDEMATKKNAEMEVVICVKPPGAHLLLCITIVFLGLLQITFIMDYLDPT
ncbi:hypothetical protein FBUS_09229 [Fasciolopsis buskii]|uniref:Uncharacterized protein n=1 Tax=Fasciolopsis buskii TaxID=27845 RepID=A0A8E0RZ95_9TREM|nr:hypothetical protein FBUS_09229 [Fasciolopsis buski]